MSASHPTGPPADPAHNGDNRTMDLLRKIEKGTVDPSGIALADRRQLVEFLMGDGYSTAEMAQILKVGDRTIERDKKFIRESNAIVRDPKLVAQMVGRLVGEAELSVQRIRKAVRDKKVPASVKVDAEHRCFQVFNDLFESMQRIGYLPTAAQRVEAELTHHLGGLPDPATLRSEFDRLKRIVHQSEETSPEIAQGVRLLEQKFSQADLATDVDKLKDLLTDAEGEDDDDE